MNAERENNLRPSEMGCLQIGVVIIAFVLLGAVLFTKFFSPYPRYDEKANITKGISNCRQIIWALKSYASDHDGKYPDVLLKDKRTANAAFRVLFEEHCVDSELIFGCPVSPFIPDGNIGNNEKTSKVLEPGENHWAMTAGASGAHSGDIPLVYENPAVATWPPKWNMDAKGTNRRGRGLSRGVVIGMDDGSVGARPLSSKRGIEIGLKLDRATGMDVFEGALDRAFPVGTILDVEDIK